MILKPLKDAIVSQGISPVYIGFVPPKEDKAVIIRTMPYFSTPDLKNGYDKVAVQVRTRSFDYVEAESMAYDIYSYLCGASSVSQNITISGANVILITPNAIPYVTGRDDLGRTQFLSEYTIEYQNITQHRR